MKVNYESIQTINEYAKLHNLRTIEEVLETLEPLKPEMDFNRVIQTSELVIDQQAVNYFFGDEEKKSVAVQIMVRSAARVMEIMTK